MKKILMFSICPTLILMVFTTSLFATPPTSEMINGMEFIQIKGGSFVMGDILSIDKDASPPHKVTVSDFLFGKFEVTFEQYDKFCDETKRAKPSDEGWGRGNRPVINVSWKDAVAYTEWISKKTGRKGKLPSESQWEYATRAGTSSQYWWGQTMETGLANCYNCGSKWDNQRTAPVGSFRPNPWGLHDMTGNAYEWTLDVANENHMGAPATDEPRSSGIKSQRIARGGSYSSNNQDLKAYFRDWFEETEKLKHTGFRVVIEK